MSCSCDDDVMFVVSLRGNVASVAGGASLYVVTTLGVAAAIPIIIACGDQASTRPAPAAV